MPMQQLRTHLGYVANAVVSWSPIVSFRVGISLFFLTLFLATSKVAVRQHDDTGRLKEEEDFFDI